MPDRLRVPEGLSRLGPVEWRELCRRVVALISSGSVLPPPVVVEVRLLRRGSERQFDVAIATGASRDCETGEFCEVTGCLDPGLRANQALDVARFREWAVSAPEHPLAVRYQPLYACLRAAKCDPRLLETADEFIRRERDRLEAELVRVAERLLRNGVGSQVGRAFRRRA
jgi:ribosomal protein S16